MRRSIARLRPGGRRSGPRLSASDSVTALVGERDSLNSLRLAPFGSGGMVSVATSPSNETPATIALTLLSPMSGSSAVSEMALNPRLPALVALIRHDFGA